MQTPLIAFHQLISLKTQKHYHLITLKKTVCGRSFVVVMHMLSFYKQLHLHTVYAYGAFTQNNYIALQSIGRAGYVLTHSGFSSIFKKYLRYTD